MPYHRYICFFLSLILYVHAILPSVISGTLIKTPHGFTSAENVAIGDTIIGYHKSLSTAVVTHISNTTTDTLVVITTNKGYLYASPDQKFFDPVLQQWVAAKNITTQNTFLDAQLNHCKSLTVETISTSSTQVFHISTTAPHNFFVSEQELLTHNAFPVLIISLAWLFGEGLKFAGLSIGAAALGSYVGVQLYNTQKQNAGDCRISLHVGSCGSPCPDPDDDENKDLFGYIKVKADKKLRHKRFGNFYRDPKTKLWWSKDNAHHGGCLFKVFKETAKGLKWTFDADELGNQIIGKHKGPIGLFISYKELISCP
jgi:hypothetical protein